MASSLSSAPISTWALRGIENTTPSASPEMQSFEEIPDKRELIEALQKACGVLSLGI